MNMKKRCLILVLLSVFLGLAGFAEEQKPLRRSIYMEFWGPSNLYGIAYDAGIKPGSKFGYRVGFSYLCGPEFEYCRPRRGKQVFGIPLEANCLLGKRRSKFEVGIGANLGIYTQKGSYWKYIYNADAGAIQRVERATVSRTHFGYYLFTNIGYRYQRVIGFLFRVGISPSFHFGGSHGIRKTPFIYPYVSFGYTFK